MLKLLVGRKVKIMNGQYSMLSGPGRLFKLMLWVAQVYD